MGSIVNKLEYSLDSKELIKQAIIDKGVEVGDNIPLREYADKIYEISGGGDVNIDYGTIEEFELQKDTAEIGTTFLVTDDVTETGSGVLEVYHSSWKTVGTSECPPGTLLTDEVSLPKGKYMCVGHFPSSTNSSTVLCCLSIGGSTNYNQAASVIENYGHFNFYFELTEDSDVALASAQTKTWTFVTEYLSRGFADFIRIDNIGGETSLDIYSTTEKVIGKWIDDRPVYRKVFDNLSVSLPSNAWTNIAPLSAYAILRCILFTDNDTLQINPTESRIYNGYINCSTIVGNTRSIKKCIVEYIKTI